MRGFAAPVFQNILRHPDADYRIAVPLRSNATGGLSTPVGCRRHPLSGELAAIEAAAPVIVLFGRLVVIFVDVSRNAGASASVDVLVYMVIELLGKLSRSASAGVLFHHM